MKHFTRVMTLGLLLVLVVAGCGDGGSSDEEANGAGDGNAATGSDEGSGDDLSIPIPPVGDEPLTTETEDGTIYTIMFPGDDLEIVIDFYDDWTSSQDAEYQRTEAESGGVTWLATVGGRLQIIAISPPLEGDNRGILTLTDSATG